MRSDGSEFPVELALSEIAGPPLIVCGSIRDLTHQKQTEAELQELAGEQAALRHVATLVARGADPPEVFATVAEEVSRLLDVPASNVVRFDGGRGATKVAGWGAGPFAVGEHVQLDEPSLMATIVESGRTARVDDYAELAGGFAASRRSIGLGSAVGAPILVEGIPWGAIVAYSAEPHRFPPAAEERLVRFTDLVATAISNVQGRDRLRNLARQQEGLRRVATLVAQRADPRAVFDAVCTETADLLGASSVQLVRHAPEGGDAVVGQAPPGSDVPAHLKARVDAPVQVNGILWGRLVVFTERPVAASTRANVESLAELVAIAVANAEDRDELVASRVRIVAAADEARRRIQRDLHDGAQSRLVASIIELQLATERLSGDPAGARLSVIAALQSVRDGLEDLRSLAAGLHPIVLTEGGLAGALDALAQRSAIPVRVEAPAARFPLPIETATYFFVAEALSNVVKHARASYASVEAAQHDERLEVAVRDDGAGGAAPGRGSGLRGLKDRIEALGGTFSIVSPNGAGTLVTASIPLSSP